MPGCSSRQNPRQRADGLHGFHSSALVDASQGAALVARHGGVWRSLWHERILERRETRNTRKIRSLFSTRSEQMTGEPDGT
jgi:hypothetical protein